MLWILVLALGGVAVWQIAIASGVGSKRLECPACDLFIMGALPSEGDSVLCGHCREIGLFEGGKLVKPSPDHIGAKPLFCAELPIDKVQWPDGCCLCGQPATRGIDVKLEYQEDAALGRDMATRAATLGMFKAVDRTTITLSIPHCAQHADGAALVMPFEREQPNFGVAFRSYPYFKQFVALNRSTPRKATMFGGPNET